MLHAAPHCLPPPSCHDMHIAQAAAHVLDVPVACSVHGNGPSQVGGGALQDLTHVCRHQLTQLPEGGASQQTAVQIREQVGHAVPTHSNRPNVMQAPSTPPSLPHTRSPHRTWICKRRWCAGHAERTQPEAWTAQQWGCCAAPVPPRPPPLLLPGPPLCIPAAQPLPPASQLVGMLRQQHRCRLGCCLPPSPPLPSTSASCHRLAIELGSPHPRPPAPHYCPESRLICSRQRLCCPPQRRGRQCARAQLVCQHPLLSWQAAASLLWLPAAAAE